MKIYIENGIEKHRIALFYALVCAILFTCFLYMYFVGAIMMQTVKHDSIYQNIHNAEREYQELEQSYLALISKFNLNYAYSLGFVGENSADFVSRQSRVAQNSGNVKTLIR